MKLSENHPEDKNISTKVLFEAQEGKVISLQILKNELLKEHLAKVPAFLVCVNGLVVYEDEKGFKVELNSGCYVSIEPNVKHWVKAVETSNLILIK